jgi:hypothetical protein
MVQDWVFEHGDRAPINLKAGDFFFPGEDLALEWIDMGIAQHESAPYPPAPPPEPIVDQHGRPLGRDACDA